MAAIAGTIEVAMRSSFGGRGVMAERKDSSLQVSAIVMASTRGMASLHTLLVVMVDKGISELPVVVVVVMPAVDDEELLGWTLSNSTIVVASHSTGVSRVAESASSSTRLILSCASLGGGCGEEVSLSIATGVTSSVEDVVGDAAESGVWGILEEIVGEMCDSIS